MCSSFAGSSYSHVLGGAEDNRCALV